MLLCPCTICFNTAKIIQNQQEVFGVTTEMNQGVPHIATQTIQSKIQNLLITKQVLREN